MELKDLKINCPVHKMTEIVYIKNGIMCKKCRYRKDKIKFNDSGEIPIKFKSLPKF